VTAALARDGAAGRAGAPALETINVTKRFPGVVANDRITFTLLPGEIHVLLGENGAGKTTLMNILYGLYHPDEGEVRLHGQPVRFNSPRDAIDHGIGMVHQHFMLVPTLTVAENVMLGMETVKRGVVLAEREAEARIAALARSYGFEIFPGALVANLPVGVQQRVEIVKALYRNATILILDEPTAVLAPQEAEELFGVMRRLARQGKSIIFITHKLKEVFAVADRITVLRHGRVVATTTPAEATEASLAALMVGRPVLLRVEKGPARPGPEVLRVEGLRVRSDRGTIAVDNLALRLRAGEILGIAGVEGNGQSELVEALTGLRPIEAGRVYLLDRDVTGAGPREIVQLGVAHVPEDRHKHGLVLSHPVADNLVLQSYYRPPFARGLLRVFRAIRDFALRLIREFDIRTPSPETPARNLSGGNQQKAVVAREFSRELRLLIAAQPTRGLDVGSTEFIHRKIVAARDAGVAVLLVSAELDEVMSLADRIAVMSRGQIVETVPAERASREELGLLMAGGTRS
jgi:simple sugar transport system ATP-binding protein